MKSTYKLILALVLAASCSSLPPGEKVETPIAGPLFFQVSHPQKPGVFYLFGSLHLGSPELYPLPPRVSEAFETSKGLILEADLTKSIDPAKLLPRIQLPPGKTLSSLLDAQTIQSLQATLPGLGVNPKDMEQFQPWFVDVGIALRLIQKEGLREDLGIDRYFLGLNQKASKELRALETLDFQLEVLAPQNMDQQILGLKETLKQAKEFQPFLENLVKGWKSGDEKALSAVFLESMKELPTTYTSLVVNRNKDWVKKLDLWASEEGTWFTVVGTGHLVGPDSLPLMLSAAGYQVKRI